MNIFNIRSWFKRKKPKVELTQQQLSDMFFYEHHIWPEPIKVLTQGDKVWVLAKGRTPYLGTVTKLRKVISGNPYWVVQYSDDPVRSVTVHPGDPAFATKEELLLWYIGEAWRRIARLYRSLQAAVDNVEIVTAYIEQRVHDSKLEIKFLENQLGHAVPYKPVE